MQGNHTAHTAIFIQYHSKQLFLLLHIPTQNIRFHNLRYKIRLLYRLRHHSFSILLHQAKIYLCIQHTNNIICILSVNGIICIAASQNCFLPFRIRFLQAQHSHIYTMCADLLYRNIIKGKYIPNPPRFLRVNRPFFLPCLQHHIDFLFGNLLLLICRVNSKELQHTVGRNRKKSHQRRKQTGNTCQHATHAQCQSFCLFHRNSFWHQLPKNQIEICQYQCNQKNRN